MKRHLDQALLLAKELRARRDTLPKGAEFWYHRRVMTHAADWLAAMSGPIADAARGWTLGDEPLLEANHEGGRGAGIWKGRQQTLREITGQGHRNAAEADETIARLRAMWGLREMWGEADGPAGIEAEPLPEAEAREPIPG